MSFGGIITRQYQPSAAIRVSGCDAFSFLQGQFSNELRQPVGSVIYGLWLSLKGKVLADSLVFRIAENEFLLASLTCESAVIRQRLEAYIVADEVEISDQTGSTHGLVLAGAGSRALAKDLFDVSAEAGRFGRRGGVLVSEGRRGIAECLEFFGPAEDMGGIHCALVAAGAVESPAAEFDAARIAAGIPSVPVDLGPGDLPNEGGLDETAVSYTKGCYLGQEVMARLKNLGRIRRRLYVVSADGAAPPALAPLFVGAKRVGEIRSAAISGSGYVALAMLSVLDLEVAAGLSLAAGGPAVVRILRHG